VNGIPSSLMKRHRSQRCSRKRFSKLAALLCLHWPRAPIVAPYVQLEKPVRPICGLSASPRSSSSLHCASNYAWALSVQEASGHDDLFERVQQQLDHLLRPAMPDILVLLLVDVHQLPQVMSLAQAVLALQAFVAGQPIMHQHAFDALQQTERLRGQRTAPGLRGQPGQGARDGVVQPAQLPLTRMPVLSVCTTPAPCTARQKVATVGRSSLAASWAKLWMLACDRRTPWRSCMRAAVRDSGVR
jgi:hypothetical protein